MKLSVHTKAVEFIDATHVSVRLKLPGRDCIYMRMEVKEDFWKSIEAGLKSAQLIERLYKGLGPEVETRISRPLSL